MKGTFSLSLIFGGYDFLFELLLIFLALDYITGVLRAIYTKKISSDIGAKGIIKKVGYILIVIVASLLDMLFDNGDKIRNLIIYMFIANESISIIDNWTNMGIKIPRLLKKNLTQIENNLEKNESEEDENIEK